MRRDIAAHQRTQKNIFLQLEISLMTPKRPAGHIYAEVSSALSGTSDKFQVAVLLHELADAVIEQVMPVLSPGFSGKVTCSNGCAHCCRQSTILIDEIDAEVLAAHTGRKISSATPTNRKWQGIACPFLNEAEQCSVYEIRPMTCRMSLSVDRPIKCKTEEPRNMVNLPTLNTAIFLDLLKPPLKESLLKSRGGKERDIREFFPPT
jgi:Fe-S-cluster containining protein